MDFEWSREQRDIKQAAREFAKGEFTAERATAFELAHEFGQCVQPAAAATIFVMVNGCFENDAASQSAGGIPTGKALQGAAGAVLAQPSTGLLSWPGRLTGRRRGEPHDSLAAWMPSTRSAVLTRRPSACSRTARLCSCP